MRSRFVMINAIWLLGGCGRSELLPGAPHAGADTGTCADIQMDNNNCGACGIVCSAVPPSKAQCMAGRCLITLASGQSFPTGIATDAASVYWVNTGTFRLDNSRSYVAGSGSVAKVPLDGGAQTTLVSGQNQARYVAVDAKSVYWTNSGTKADDGSVMKTPLSGGSITTLASSQSVPMGIAVDASDVYWVNGLGGTVMEIPLNGGAITTIASGQSTPVFIVVDATNLCWTNWGATGLGDGAVTVLPLRGGPSAGAANQTKPYGVAMDSTSVYWTQGTAVMTMSLHGGPIAPIASGPDGAQFVAVDAKNVYWTTGTTGGAVMRAPLGGGTPTTLAYGQNGADSLAIDESSVYWTDQWSGSVMRLTPK